MLRFLKVVTMAGLTLVGATASASAQQAPWEQPRPPGMTEAHIGYAAAAKVTMDRLGNGFVGSPGWFRQGIWDRNGLNQSTPVANMAGPDLSRLLAGRYFVFQNPVGGFDAGDNWSVIYYGVDGTAHFCIRFRNYEPVELTKSYQINPSDFGLTGPVHWSPAEDSTPDPSKPVAFPLVANGRTGQVAHYIWEKNAWTRQIGWVQNEYAAAFAEHCPNLPRAARVNEAQSGGSIQEIARGARAVSGFRTAFDNDPADPLTARMLYWAYPAN